MDVLHLCLEREEIGSRILNIHLHDIRVGLCIERLAGQLHWQRGVRRDLELLRRENEDWRPLHIK